MRRAWLHVGLLSIVLLACFLAGRGQPLVRNGLVYARAAWNVIDAGCDPRPVVADSRLSYDKPIGFAWLAAPLVARLGGHDGLRVASLAGTLAFLLATLWFAWTFLPPARREQCAIALLWLAAFGPLVAYQSWSAHPDAWFAALVVVAIVLAEKIATGPPLAVPRRSIALAATLIAAFLLKNYALILVPSCALHLALHWMRARRMRDEGGGFGRRAAWCGGALLAAGGFVVAARLGMNPFSRMEGEGGGADQYAFASIGSIWWKTLAQCGIALALQFHVTLLAAPAALAGIRLPHSPPTDASPRRDLLRPWLSFGALYVAGLLPFPTAFYNMRYFLPLFPLAALVVVRGAGTLRPALRTAGLVAFLAINAATMLLFDVPALFDAARPRLPDARVEWLENGPPLSLLDNLRMEQHRDQAAWLRAIDEQVEPGAVLYLLDVVYYRDAQQQVFERDGWIRADVTTRYASRRDFHPAEPRFYVWSYPSSPPPLAAFGRVTDLGHRLYRVDAGSDSTGPAIGPPR